MLIQGKLQFLIKKSHNFSNNYSKEIHCRHDSCGLICIFISYSFWVAETESGHKNAIIAQLFKISCPKSAKILFLAYLRLYKCHRICSNFFIFFKIFKFENFNLR